MEIALDSAIPTYSGGLGVLAGDTLRAAADMSMPMVGVTLLYRKGYFHQHLDPWGNQTEGPALWAPEEHLEKLQTRVAVTLRGRRVVLQTWRHLIQGTTGFALPVYLLDANVQENAPEDRELTDYLYGGDQRYRLIQEAIIGLGGVALLRALGHESIQTYHMNEGHAAFLGLALLEERVWGKGLSALTEADLDAVRARCVFTTHTPVAAGHDQFPLPLVEEVLGVEKASALETMECCMNGTLNMTYMALHLSRYINGVALSHGKVTRGMFPDYPINSITNGVHAGMWVSAPFERLYDQRLPEWRRDNSVLRYAVSLPLDTVRQAHAEAKKLLLDAIKERLGVALDPRTLTIGFARRATPYKRADLLFSDMERLRRIARQVGPVQVVYGGKAHPRDEGGKAIIQRIFQASDKLRNDIHVVYLEEYDMALGQLFTAGADIWLNTPFRPQEASGTSGMKAALNGVPSFSVLDGWWVEGHIEGVTGWAIGDEDGAVSDTPREIASLYDKLENVILPMFYRRPDEFARIMRSAVALNGSYFNAQRMLAQYARNAYGLAGIF
jgi:starch phosphorylase